MAVSSSNLLSPSGLVDTLNRLGSMPPPSGPPVDPPKPYGLVHKPGFHIKSWEDEMDWHDKEKEDLAAKSSGSLQETGDHSLPPGQKSQTQDDIFMVEAEHIPSLFKES